MILLQIWALPSLGTALKNCGSSHSLCSLGCSGESWGIPRGMLLLSWPFFSVRDAHSASVCPKPLCAQKCCSSSIPLWLFILFVLSPPSVVSLLHSLLFSAFPQTHPVLFVSHWTLLRKQKQWTKPNGLPCHILPQKQGFTVTGIEAPTTNIILGDPSSSAGVPWELAPPDKVHSSAWPCLLLSH